AGFLSRGGIFDFYVSAAWALQVRLAASCSSPEGCSLCQQVGFSAEPCNLVRFVVHFLHPVPSLPRFVTNNFLSWAGLPERGPQRGKPGGSAEQGHDARRREDLQHAKQRQSRLQRPLPRRQVATAATIVGRRCFSVRGCRRPGGGGLWWPGGGRPHRATGRRG
ncbi:unnamed protein product, partial [Phaeothamnion confervicola]